MINRYRLTSTRKEDLFVGRGECNGKGIFCWSIKK